MLFQNKRPVALGNKLSIYPHILAIVGFRGLAGLHHEIDLALNGGYGWLDIEEVAEDMRGALSRYSLRPHRAQR